jgi:SAM-dependent methyltransferase
MKERLLYLSEKINQKIGYDNLKKVIPNPIYFFLKKEILKSAEGGQYECPICKNKLSSFSTHKFPKGNPLKDMICFYCGSMVRHRAIYLYLKDKNIFETEKNIKILHFAPEWYFYNIIKENKNINYYPCDFNPNQKQFEKMKIEKIDMTNIPYEDNFFDIIICNHVLEHIPNDKKAMIELYRVLKEDGWGILQVPLDYNRETTFEDNNIIDPKERELTFGQWDHVRWYGKDYPERLESAGFKVKKDEFVKSLGEENIKKYGLMESEILYIVSK